MREQYGNLALKAIPAQKRQQPVRIAVHKKPIRPTIETVRVEPMPIRSQAKNTAERSVYSRRIRHELTINRIKNLVLIICTVGIVTGIFGLMVYRQSMILKANFSNLAIIKQVSKFKEETGQIKERLAMNSQLDLIRTQAVQKLGLQVPASRQIVTVVIPNSDRVIFNDTHSSDPDTENYLISLLFNLEGFFKTLDVKGQG